MNAAVEKLTNIEWLGQQLRAKTANYEATTPSTGGNIPPNWEDRCAAIAALPNAETKAYACILAWGDYRDNSEHYKVLVKHLAGYLLVALEKEVKRRSFDLHSFCEKVVRMELFYILRPWARELYTLKGRLVFSGITEINPDTYSKNYAYLGEMVKILIGDLEDEIDHYIGDYRYKLNRSN